MPSFPIVDSHVHLYDIAHLSYPWLANVPKINKSHGLAEFDAARGSVEVDGIVFAEVAVAPGQHLDEAAWAQGLADGDERIKGIVAHAPLEKGTAVEDDLIALKRNASLRGIRRLIEVELDPRLCLEQDFLDALNLLPHHGLVFDICVKHWCLSFALELAHRCPDVSFVIDHAGKPGIKHGMWEPWKEQMKELARMPNVVCKLSGMITEADHDKWTKDDVKPYVAHIIDCFGFGRLMYGSDWTVAELTHAYPDWVALIDEVIVGSSESEQRQLYRDTAIRTYHLQAI
ncbi:MAG: amidohydrolase family protein [Geminicoccaceae bacterium]|nr:amidohydrolase family protein [Geminicoccaceae bacterium]